MTELDQREKDKRLGIVVSATSVAAVAIVVALVIAFGPQSVTSGVANGVNQVTETTVRAVTTVIYIAPGKVNGVTVASAGKKKVVVRWSEVSGAEGYQVDYRKSLSRKQKKGSRGGKWKTKMVGANRVSVRLNKLGSKKKYVFRVRAYKTNPYKAKRDFGAWSSMVGKRVK